MKKIFICIVAFSLMICTFVGCTRDESASSTVTPAVVNSGAENVHSTAAPTEPVTLPEMKSEKDLATSAQVISDVIMDATRQQKAKLKNTGYTADTKISTVLNDNGITNAVYSYKDVYICVSDEKGFTISTDEHATKDKITGDSPISKIGIKI